MDVTVGLPRALLYHKYESLWTAFFEALDVPTVVSPPSNKAILERGSRLAVDETCLPVKLFLGHVDALRDRADVVMVPRIASLTKDEPACVKFMGAFDVARNAVPDIELIEYNVDVRNGFKEAPEIRRLGRRFEPSRLKVAWAYAQARRESERHQARVAAEQELAARSDGLKVLVVGHAYNIEDALIGGPVVSLLREFGATPILAELADLPRARLLAANLSTDVPWTYNKELLGAVEHFRPYVDGMVFLVSFPCGPDSLMTELCVRRIKGMPNLVLVLDELQGEAGLRTRLESFVDLLELAHTHTRERGSTPEAEPLLSGVGERSDVV